MTIIFHLFNLIKNRVDTVKGNFRQKETLELWEDKLDKLDNFKLNYYETMISSGGYVRSIANSMGGVAFDIFRKEYLTT